MEKIRNDPILKYNEDTLFAVRKLFNLDKPGAMKQSVDLLDEWVKQQPHFKKKNFDREYLEMTIIVSKGSVERAKERLDKACTLRTLMSNFFGDFDLRTDFVKDLKDIKHAVLPRLTKNHERLLIFKSSGKTYEPTIGLSFTRAAAYIAEYLRRNDYASSHIVVIDYIEANIMELAAKISINDFRHLFSIMMEGYGFRLKGIHFITPSKLVDLVISMLKQVLPAKISERIRVHKDIESFHEEFDRDILPAEYGGKEKSLEELHDDWVELLSSKEFKSYMNEMNTAKTDESLRPTDKFNEQYLGMPGTFRTLNVD